VTARTIRLPGDARAAAAARAALEPVVAELPKRRRADARLLATELVANAFRHGKPPITLTLELLGTHLRVEVADAGGGRPQRRPEPGADGGWGLLLVESAADRWGVADGSTNVWFEIDR
jgi:anti-sigma regulatory factor (Ser/Thr protein kinase)